MRVIKLGDTGEYAVVCELDQLIEYASSYGATNLSQRDESRRFNKFPKRKRDYFADWHKLKAYIHKELK